MIIDDRNEFCDATSLNTGGAGNYLIGDVMDLGGGAPSALGDGINVGPELSLVIQVDTAATSGGSNTTQFHLCSDAQAAIAVDGTATYHWSSPAIPVATLAAGYYVARVRVPSGTYERYLGVLQTTAAAALTAGKVNAFLTPNANTFKAFANDPGDTLKNT